MPAAKERHSGFLSRQSEMIILTHSSIILMTSGYEYFPIIVHSYIKLNRAAANLAVFNILLLRDRRIDENFDDLPAIGALDVLRFKCGHGSLRAFDDGFPGVFRQIYSNKIPFALEFFFAYTCCFIPM